MAKSKNTPAATESPSALLTTEDIHHIADGLENPVFEVANAVHALRFIADGCGDRQLGGAIYLVADQIQQRVDAISEGREQILDGTFNAHAE